MIDLIDGAGMAEAWTSTEIDARQSASTGRAARRHRRPTRTSACPASRSGLEVAGVDRRVPRGRPGSTTRGRARRVRPRRGHPLGHRRAAHPPRPGGRRASTSTRDRADAFDAADAALLVALADQAAVAIANARLIEELERSRAEVARRADAERTLREIAARVSAILDPAEVLQRIVDEAARLLESDGARIDLYDPEIDALRWSYAAGDAMSRGARVGDERRPQARARRSPAWPSPSSARS